MLVGDRLVADHLADVLEAGDGRQQAFGVPGQQVDLGLLFGGERRTGVQFGYRLGSEDDRAYLRKHGGDLDTPGVGWAGGLDHLGDDGPDAGRPGESGGVGQAQDFEKGGYAPPQRALDKLTFGPYRPVLGHGVGQRLDQDGPGARLEEEPEDVAVIDGRQGVLHVGLAGQQYAHGVRTDPQGLGQHGGTVHAGHAHIGHEDGKGRILAQERQRLGARLGPDDGELGVQLAPEAVQDGRLIVDTQDPRTLVDSGSYRGIAHVTLPWR